MENQNRNTYLNVGKLKKALNEEIDDSPFSSDFNSDKNYNKKILEKNINFKYKSNFNNNDEKNNINFNDMNNNIDNIMNDMKMNEEIKPMESSLTSKIYEKNITQLKEKIREQENEIKYLNERLKNYDTTMEEMTKLNIELNRLNEIIRNKNNTIQEFREISELSKKKFEELIRNKKELLQKIKTLEKENEDLRSKNKFQNKINSNEDEYNPIKLDLNYIKKENQQLKKILQEKNEKIKNMNNIIEKSNLSSPRYMNYTPHHRNFNYDFNYKQGKILRTEPINFNSMINSYSSYEKEMGINKYNYLKNKYSMEPLKYSKYLLDNLQNNIKNNYLNNYFLFYLKSTRFLKGSSFSFFKSLLKFISNELLFNKIGFCSSFSFSTLLL